MAQDEAVVKEIASLLQGTLTPNSHVQSEAERRLRALEVQKGFLSSLFKLIAVIDGVPMEIRLAGSIYLKNMIRRSWDHTRYIHDGGGETRTTQLDEGEKALVRDNLLEALVHSHPSVRPQIAETHKSVVMVDFPQSWPSLLPGIIRNLESGEDLRLLAALIALRNIAKVYEFKIEKDGDTDPRAPLNEVVEVCFPRLLELNAVMDRRLVESRGLDDTAHELQRYICKTFWSATEFALPPYILAPEDNFRKWMESLVTALRRPVAPESMEGKTDPDELLQVPAWKVKKWLGHIMHRYFQRYGDPRRVTPNRFTPKEAMVKFADVFLRNYAGAITSAMLEVLSWPRTLGMQISPRVANLALNYIDAALVPAVTYEVIRPNVDALLTEIVFPYLCINDADAALWDDDPIEYVRKAYDVLEDFYSPRAAACNVIFAIGKLRAKRTIIPFLSFLAGILTAYANAPAGSPEKDREARSKDGALLAIGYIKEKLLAKPEFRANLEQILSGHVQPEFQSPYPFLRARACWLFGQLASTSSDIMSVANVLVPALQGVLGCLSDRDFPVRVQAAVDIRFFLTNDSATQLIRPHLQLLLEHLFKLIDEVDNTNIIATIEELARKFQADIPPFAPVLCSKLVETYLRAASAGEDDEESNLAAMQCLHGMNTILHSIAYQTSSPQLFKEIEPVFARVFDVMFDVDKMEFFEESLEVLSTYVFFYADRFGVSPYLWTIFPKIFDAFDKWAIEFVEHLLAPIDNYISLGTETFLNGRDGEVSYLNRVVLMIDRLWGDGLDDTDADKGTRLVDILLLNCKGRIDQSVGQLLEMTINRMRVADTDQLRVRLLANIGCALYYDAALTLQVLTRLGYVKDVFAMWLGNLKSFTRIHDKKLSAVGLSSILLLPVESLPPEIQAGYSQIIIGIMELLEQIKSQQATRNQDPNQGALEYFRYRGMRADVDFEDGEDAEDEFSALFRQRDIDDTEDYLDSEDEEHFESPLDEVNEELYFVESFRAMGEANANKLGSALPHEQQERLRFYLNRAAESAHVNNAHVNN